MDLTFNILHWIKLEMVWVQVHHKPENNLVPIFLYLFLSVSMYVCVYMYVFEWVYECVCDVCMMFVCVYECVCDVCMMFVCLCDVCVFSCSAGSCSSSPWSHSHTC